MKLTPKDSKLLIGFSVLLLVLTGIMFVTEFELDRPWKKIQRDFKKLDMNISSAELQKLQAEPDSDGKTKKLTKLQKRLEKINQSSPTIKQLWLTHFDTADRCTTCHLGIELSRFANSEQPFTTHPGKHIDPNRHPLDTFGCVICHEGQGVGLTVEEAHGLNHHNWMSPLLAGSRAESSCEACHPMKKDVAKNAVLVDAPTFSKGRSIYLNNNCLGCHNLEGFRRDVGIGPILTKLTTKTNQSWTAYWIQDPKKYLPKTVMPNFELPKEEIEAITAYLFTLSSPEKANTDARARLDDMQAVERGKQKLDDLGCLGCHTVDGKNEGFGPDFSRIAEKVNPDWLYAWITDPKKYWPETSMPDLRIPKEDIQDLVAYLNSLKGSEPLPVFDTTFDEELVNQGRELVLGKGCTGCHQIEKFPLGYNAPAHDGIGQKRVDELVFADTVIPETLADWLLLKTKNPRAFNTKEMPTLMPKFGFTDQETKDLLTFLLSIRERHIPAEYIKVMHDPASPPVTGELLIERSNCRGCHKIGKTGGMIGPDLNFEGERVNPEWLSGFLQNPTKIRPIGIEPTRMPTFDFTPEEAENLAAYFADMNHVEYPHYIAEKKEMSAKDIEDSWRLFYQTFSCHACHAWNDQGGIIGPDQSDLGNRLRKEWISKWLMNPQSYIRDIQMPNFELYPEEAEKLTELMMSFTDISPALFEQIKKRWDDEQLAKQAQQMMGDN
jgi:mono/diheme cytochrome c family protein